MLLGERTGKQLGRITDDEMREMNYQVSAEGRSARDVAKQFLMKAGLV
ncbi:glycine betaine ABC transporter substrate-binding protein [Paenibacillus thiaminolyticus]